MKHEASISHTPTSQPDSSWDNLTPSPESPMSPADRFRVNPNDYTILINQDELDTTQGNNQKHLWNIDKTLHTYANRTAELIATIDGSSTEYEDQLSRRLMQDIKQMHKDFQQGHILLSPENYDDDRLDALMEAQGLQLLPASNPAPNNFIRIKNDLMNRPPAI